MMLRCLALLAFVLPVLVSTRAIAYGDSQWEWRSSATGSTAYATKAAALAATKALGNGYELLDREEGVADENSQWVSYKYSVSPRPPVVQSDWLYITGSYQHTTEAAARAFVYNNIATNYSHPNCPPQLNPRADWISDSNFYGISVHEYREFDDIRYWWSAERGCYEMYNPPALRYVMYRQRTAGCPTGFFISLGQCHHQRTAQISSRPPVPVCGALTRNPCDIANGSKSLTENDYQGRVPFARYYHSQLPQALANLGVAWTHTYSSKLVVNTSPLAWLRSDGNQEPLTAINNYVNGAWQTHWVSLAESDVRVEKQGTTFVLFTGSGERWIFTSTGALDRIIGPSGEQRVIARDANGRVSTVSDDAGHQLVFGYLGDGTLGSLSVAGTTIATFGYDLGARNLTTVTYADGTSRSYLYGDPNFPNHLTGLVDEAAEEFKSAQYDVNGRVVRSELAGGVERIDIQYNTNSSVVTPIIGLPTTYSFTSDLNQHRRVISVTTGAQTSLWQVPNYPQDPMRRVTQTTDARGTVTKLVYDAEHLTTRTEAFGTPTARTTTFTYQNAQTELPATIEEAARKVTFVRDSQGRILSKTVADKITNETRSWAFTYSATGQVLTADGPRTDVSDVTTYTYYNCTAGYQCGQVETITNALGHVTTYNTYNAHGQPLTITDPNGIITTLTYDLRQRLTSRTVGSELTSFEYWPTGLLKKATLPDGSFLAYTYDAAHRLTDITDADGNTIHYVLDAMGNRTGEETRDASSALTRTRTQIFNTLNQLWRQIGAAGGASVTTIFGYDNNGNQTSIAAPLSRTTGQTYDELNRLKTVTDPATGLTTYGYNALDQLISVTDPKSLTTSYTYNALGDLKTQVSPDTGTTTNTYDSGGNLATSTDARSATATYAYDSLNRVTSVAYGDQTIAYG